MMVRAATKADVHGVIACARHYEHFETDDGRVRVLTDMSLHCEGMFVAVDRDQVVGFCCALVLPHPFGTFDYIDVVALFVQPSHRATWAGAGLVRHILRFSSTTPLDMVKISAPVTSHLGTLLVAHGFAAAETVYLKGDRWQLHRS